MKLILANLALIAFHPQATSALSSNVEQAPQVLSKTTNVCLNSGNRPSCEVELDVPESCVVDGKSDCPVVFFLHGSGGTNNWFGRTSGVHQAGYIGIYPQGEGGWNTGPKSTNECSWDVFDCEEDPDESGFIANIISEVRNQGANGNVYVIGNSNGAALAMRLASNAGEELPIKGIVTKVTQLLSSPERSGPGGGLNYNQPSSLTPKVSVLNVMGTADNLIPYTGGTSSVFGGDLNFQLMDALDSMKTWAGHNGCNTQPEVTEGLSSDQGTGATFYEYKDCADGTIVEHYAILGGGHNAGGATVDNDKIDYVIAFDFIDRCEAGSASGPPSLPPPPSTAAPVSAPNPTTNACVDDPTWAGKFNSDHTCSYIALESEIRCNWVDINGVTALVGCPATCDASCQASPTTSAPVTTTPPPSLPPPPSTAAPVSAPSPTTNACVDDPTWVGKFNSAHTCSYVAEAPDFRCDWVNVDSVQAKKKCKATCDPACNV